MEDKLTVPRARMKCPKCQSDTKDEAKFCGKCGAKLLPICPQCGFENTPGNNFCEECGHNLTTPTQPIPADLSFDEKIAKIQRYLPEGLTEKILSQRDRIEGERKQVTVMFCDMEGFTALTERLGPEEAYSVMDQVYEILIHKVHDYEGTVNEMTGDGIVALFGAPIALEDAPQRAIRSSMAIHREITRFSERIREEAHGVKSLRMRIGIHSGPVVVGTLGNDLRVEFKAVGDTVNLASRMEELAGPGTTYVTEETFRLTEGLFRFEALGGKDIKGKEESVDVYQVIAPSTRRTRFDVSAERGLTPFVGRDRELELLLDGFERAKEGRGQAFSIVAEAGIGKSRLLYEFRKAVSSEDITFLEGRCLSYSKGIAYHPFIDILKANFNIREGDGNIEIRQKVKEGLKTLGANEALTLPYLLELLSVEDSGIEEIPMSPEARKDRIIDALKRISLRGSEIRPLIMAYEDIHWIDKSSEDALKHLLESIAGARVLLIFTYRPEFVHTWGAKSFHNQLNLNRLSNRESLAMVNSLLRADDIDSSLEELILEKTEGVPFFIEEFLKSLRDLNIIERKEDRVHLAKDIQDITIPSTIQDVIMARVDSLPNPAKEVLQTGSVIGREFNYDLIKRVTGLSQDELLSHLSVLKDSELLYERGIYPVSIYIFKHAVTQEVLYDSILTERRKKIHEQIGRCIEELYEENIGEYYGMLSEHFIESENYEKASKYSRLARKKAEKTASLNDAIEYGKKTVACLERLPLTDAVQKERIDARTSLALYYTQTSYNVDAKLAVDPIIELAVEHDYKARLSQIYGILGAYHTFVEEDFSRAFEHLEQALEISGKTNDVASLGFGSYWMALSLAFSGAFEEALNHFEKVLHINLAGNNLFGISTAKSIISFCVYYFQGNVKLAYQTSDEAIQIAEQSGDIFSKAFAHCMHGASCYGSGFLEEATNHLLKAVDVSERNDLFLVNSISRLHLGETLFEIGEYMQSRAHYDKAVLLLETHRLLPSMVSLNRIGSIRARVMNNEKDYNLKLLHSYAYENKLNIYEGWMQGHIAEILLDTEDDVTEAEKCIKQAIEADKRNHMMFRLGRDYALYAELFKRKGDKSKAKETLTKAIDIYKECGADGWVEKGEKELASIS